MRTDDEILARIKEPYGSDPLGFRTQDLIVRLPFDKAQAYLNQGVDAIDWTPAPRDRDSLLAVMLEYMPFAWEKANGKRGISASRTMSHYASWTWLAGDDFGDLENYECYGKDNLVRICQHYGWDHSQWDDGVRENR